MTALLAVLMILAVVAFVTFPLLGETGIADVEATSGGDELWQREKAVAVLAITEADFDRATGKLSESDYGVLRSDYEGRALQAMDELDRLEAREVVPPEEHAEGLARFCGNCGARFASGDAFCGGCGKARLAA
jgi:hypothetical protein